MTQSRPPQPGASRKHVARAEREAMLQRWVITGTVAIVALIGGLIGYGLLDQYVLQPRQPVAKVRSVEITTAEFQKMVKYQRVQLINQYAQINQIVQFFGNDPNAAGYYQSQLNQIQIQLTDPNALGRRVLDDLIEDEIIRQEAATRGLTVPAEEVDKSLREAFGYFPDGTPTPLPSATSAPTETPTLAPTPALSGAEGAAPGVTATAAPTRPPTQAPTAGPSSTPLPSATPYTAEEYQKNYAELLKRLETQAGMSEADIRRIFESLLLRAKLSEAVTADTPREVVEAHARHILVEDEAAAKDLIARLQKGEDFAALAAQYSTDISNKDQGGDLGTFGPGRMVAEFDQVVFSAAIGVYTEPVKTGFGWHVIEILSRAPRQLTDNEYEQKQGEAFTQWLTDQHDNSDQIVEYDLWQLRVPSVPSVEEVLNNPTATP